MKPLARHDMNEAFQTAPATYSPVYGLIDVWDETYGTILLDEKTDTHMAGRAKSWKTDKTCGVRAKTRDTVSQTALRSD